MTASPRLKLKLTLQTREMALLLITVTMAVAFVILTRMILPAWDDLRDARMELTVLHEEQQRLDQHLALRRQVAGIIEQLPAEVTQAESDEITLSSFLRQIEELARYPNMTLINMKPEQPERGETYTLFPVSVTLAGRLEDVLRFVAAAASGEMVIGCDGFSIRAVQGGSVVECTFSLWRVCLTDRQPRKASAAVKVATRGGGDPDAR